MIHSPCRLGRWTLAMALETISSKFWSTVLLQDGGAGPDVTWLQAQQLVSVRVSNPLIEVMDAPAPRSERSLWRSGLAVASRRGGQLPGACVFAPG